MGNHGEFKKLPCTDGKTSIFILLYPWWTSDIFMLVWHHREKLLMGQINKRGQIPMSISTQHNSTRRAYGATLKILHMCQIHTVTIVGVRVMNIYMKSYMSHTLVNVLKTQEKENKDTYLLPWLEQKMFLPPSLFLVMGY